MMLRVIAYKWILSTSNLGAITFIFCFVTVQKLYCSGRGKSCVPRFN